MALQTEVKGVKVVIHYDEGSQTLSNFKKGATDASLYNVAEAVSSLHAQTVDYYAKVVESTLIMA